MRKIIFLIIVSFIIFFTILFQLQNKRDNSLLFEISTEIGNIEYKVALLSSNRERHKQDIYFDIIIDDNDETQVPRFRVEHPLPALGVVDYGNVSKTTGHFRAAEWVTLDELEKIIRSSTLTITNKEGEKITYKLESINIRKTFIDPFMYKDRNNRRLSR